MQRLPAKMGGGWMPLWNVESPGTPFPVNGTVSEHSLKSAGYFVPNPTGYKIGQVFAVEPA
jgi:hypothetical protein